MKIALISDLHANVAALDATLTDIAKSGVDRVVCLGDIAALGPEPREIVARVRELDCLTIQGNHDPTAGEEHPALRELEIWTESQLDRNDLDWLRNLPGPTTVDLEPEVAMLCVHGSPRSFDELMLAETPAQTLQDALQQRAFSVMACGHTHVQLLRRHADCSIVNVGSVGMPFEDALFTGGPPRIYPWAEYGIVSSSAGKLAIDLRRVPYDFDRYADAVRSSSMPVREWWLDQWIHP